MKLIIASIILLVIAQFVHGFVLCTLWEWFIVKSFEFASLTMPVAIGICLISSYLGFHQSIEDTKHSFEEIFIHSISLLLGKSIMVLTIGYIVKWFL
jgi:hypothetical protein